jgi:phage regulator Rha-like protein
MSTVEIAELTGKRHDNVMADARTMLSDLKLDVLTFQAIFYDSYGRPQICLNLPKLECLTLVAGYSAELRYRIVGRWIELEAQRRRAGSDDRRAARQCVPLTCSWAHRDQ